MKKNLLFKLLAVLIVLITSATQMRAAVTGGEIYFDVSTSGWGTPSTVEYIISHDSYSCWYRMTSISNTKLYHITSSSWGDAKYIAFTGNYGWTSCEGNSYDSRKGYGPSGSKRTAKNTYGVNSGSYYLFYASSSANDAAITTSSPAGYLGSGKTYTALNYTQTLNQTLSTDGGSTYSASTIVLATVGVSSYELNGKTSTTSSSGTISSGSSSTSCSAARTATVTYTVSSVTTGYEFVGWYDGSTQKSTSTTYTYTSTAAKTITARFKKKQYTVSYGVYASSRWGSIILNSGSAVTTTSSSTLNHGTAIAFTATPNSGYQVEGWYSDAACSAVNRLQSGGTSYNAGTLTAAKTVYVKFETRTGGVITLNAGTGGQVSKDNSNWGSSATITGVTSAATKNIYARANTGYSFNTWTKNSGSGTITTNAASGVFTPVAYEDATVTASFTEVKSTITVTTATSSQGTLKFGSTSKSWGTTASLGVATTQEITATAADGFTFVRWDLSGAAASSSTLTNATITLKANGSGNTGTATAVFEEDLSSPWIVAGGNKIVTTGTTWRTTADEYNSMLKKTGHSTESVVYFTVPVSTVCSGDNNGNFQFKIYNTSTSTWYSLGADGSSYYLLKAEDGVEKTLVTNGKNIELRAYVTGDYEFKLDYSSTPKLTVTWPVYNQLRFYSARTGGTGTNTYDFSTASTPWTKTVNLTAGSTYWFKVVEDSEFFGNTGTMTRENCSGWTMSNVTENCGITPDFTGDYEFSYNPSTNLLSVIYPAAYKLTYDIGTVKGGNGSITSDPSTTSGSYVLSGNSVTLTAPDAKTGYTWKGWYLAADGSGTRQSSAKAYAVTMNADKTLYACYTENAYNVTVSAGTGGTVSPSGTVSVKQVSGTSITATPNTDFIFKDWTISGGGITPTTSSTSPQTFKATTTGGTITANFTNQWAICGIDDWETWNGLPKKTTNVYEGTVTLTAGNHSFKVVDRKNNAWYGKNSTTITRASSSVTGLSTSGNNITITADVPGTYTFNFNTSTKNLTVTYPTAYSVTYDGNGKTSGDVPAVSYHIPASDVTLANNSGYLYKEGYAFNGWNTAATPSGSSTHYDAGGTLSSIGANTTLYAEWVRNDYTMYFFNKDDWSPADAYMWSANNDPELAYPGRTMTQYQGQVYQIDYNHNVQAKVVFNNGQTGVDERKTNDLTIAGGQTGNYWFYNDEDWEVKTGGIHDGWSQYIMVGHFPTSTVAAVVGEKVTVVPTVVWADGINFADINITSTRTSGPTDINAVVSGTNIIVSGSAAGTATFDITYTYSTHTEATITKTLTVKVMNGLTIQAKIPSDDNHWVYSNIVKMHYWGGAGTDANPSFAGDVTMSWIKDGDDGKYYQASVPVGTEATPKTNFIFFYDNFDNPWRKTQDVTNVTENSCYTIKHDAGLDKQRNAVKEGTGLCNDSWSIQITMGSGDIYTSNIVETSDEIVSFFAPSNASESKSYRQGVVTIEHNGTSVATVPASTFAASGVYTAKINTATPALTDVVLYDGNYYIRTDGAAGGWDEYKESSDNLMTSFTRNANFPNETYSYYWVKNIAKTSEGSGDVNIKAVVANDYNPVLCNFSINEYIPRSTNGTNLRFGYEPTTNDLIRGLLEGSTESNFLNIVGEDNNIFKDLAKTICLNEDMYTSDVSQSTLTDVSNWVYLIDVYAEVANTSSVADVVLKSYYNGVHYLLGMKKDATGHDTNEPITYPVIQSGTTSGTYRIRVVYDFKTNRLFGAWNPENMDVTGTLNVDADVIFIRHEMGDVAQINITNAASKVDKIQQALFALEVENDASKALGNRELHYWITLPFDCKVSNIFGIGGFMNYWGIQRYNGAKRAQIGWFKETSTFWEWLGTEETLQKGEGYLLSIDKYALQQGGQWREYGGKSQLTLYFPSTTNGFSITQATGADLTTTYAPLICTITREDRDLYDSNWRCIGTPGYKNITVASWDSIGDKYDPDSVPPRFLYEFHEQTTSAVYAQGTYTVTDGSAFTYHSFNSYLAQYAGTITWNPYSKSGSSSIAPKRSPLEGEKTTKAEIDLLGDDDELLDRAFVWLQEGATIGYDQNYDLNKIVQKKANQIYSLAEAGAPYAANILPFGTDTVQMVVNIVNEGEFIFSLNTDKHVGMAPVLYDMFKSESINLLTTDYAVELEKGNYEDRFFLLFQPEAPIVTSFETTNDGGQNVHSSEAIYDVLGRRVNTIYPGHLYIVNGEKRIAK